MGFASNSRAVPDPADLLRQAEIWLEGAVRDYSWEHVAGREYARAEEGLLTRKFDRAIWLLSKIDMRHEA